MMLHIIRRRRLIVNIPFPVARGMAGGFSLGNRLTFGLLPMQITPDQVRSLRVDNVVADGAKGFAELGLAPAAMESILPDYLWRFRASGQYTAIKESAGNLKG
jgi:NADH dehydrogenase